MKQGVLTRTVIDGNNAPSSGYLDHSGVLWPYDQPFHLILNIAVGGMWGRSGGGIDDDIFPQKMEVDYVRVYEQDITNR